jgi:hypothetical protein
VIELREQAATKISDRLASALLGPVDKPSAKKLGNQADQSAMRLTTQRRPDV